MKGLYPAKVINNNDPKKKGRVQIKIEHLHYGFSNEMLPWAHQSNKGLGGSDQFGSSIIPENDSFVWIWFEEVDTFFKRPYYLCDIHFSNHHPHNLFEENIKSNVTSESEYPNTKYIYFKNGICIGVDTNAQNPEVFIYHPGAYVFINKNGEIHLKGGTTALESSVLGETLKVVLDKIIDEINLITVPTGTGPSGTPINAAAFTAIKNDDIPTILSEKVKNN